MKEGEILNKKGTDLVKALEKIHLSFAEATFKLGENESDVPATKGDLYNALSSINVALMDIEVAFSEYLSE